ncbi:MAG: PEP-CTERM sorting domain-containing protein [Pirellulaceae bacterium]|nr:PEP-CTERM sorting domain-containing protein [Pirellulaceae bacterium]
MPNFAVGDFITFSNSTRIVIPRQGTVDPFPIAIAASGVTGQIDNFTLTIDGISHAFLDDVAAVLVSPRGTAVMLFDGAGRGTEQGGPFNIGEQVWVFDENAPAAIPLQTAPVSGRYRPGASEWTTEFAAGAPRRANIGSSFIPFRTEDPNGNWQLYIQDFSGGDSGAIERGWSITFEINATAVPEPGTVSLALLAVSAICTRRAFRKRQR